jgi:hypothetical protein
MNNILHVYSQDAHHDAAHLVMTRDAAVKLRSMLCAMLDQGYEKDFDCFYVNDGEGYNLRLIIVDDGTADRLSTPYTSENHAAEPGSLEPWKL